MEQNGTKALFGRRGEKQRVSPFFSSSSSDARQRGDSPPHNPPKGGCVGGENNPPLPTRSDREAMAEQIRKLVPTCAAIAAQFRAEFPEVRLVYASENGHTIGQRSPDGVKLSETGVGPMALQRKGK